MTNKSIAQTQTPRYVTSVEIIPWNEAAREEVRSEINASHEVFVDGRLSLPRKLAEKIWFPTDIQNKPNTLTQRISSVPTQDGIKVTPFVSEITVQNEARLLEDELWPELKECNHSKGQEYPPGGSFSTAQLTQRFLASCSAGNLRDDTIRSYSDRLMPFVRAFAILPSKAEDVEAYVACHRGHNSTAWNHYIVIRLLYNFAEARDLLPFPNPIRKIKAPRKEKNPPQHLNLSQLQALYEACETDRERGLVVCLFGMGIRLRGTRHITVGDIGENTLTVEPKRSGVAKESEILHPEFRQVLARLAEGKKSSDFIFPGQNGKNPLSDSAVQLIIKKLFKRAGIKGVRASPHTGRHTRGALGDLLGLSTYSNRRLLGHTTTQMTDRYSELNLEELRVEDRRFNPLLQILTGSDIKLGKKPDYT